MWGTKRSGRATGSFQSLPIPAAKVTASPACLRSIGKSVELLVPFSHGKTHGGATSPTRTIHGTTIGGGLPERL